MVGLGAGVGVLIRGWNCAETSDGIEIDGVEESFVFPSSFFSSFFLPNKVRIPNTAKNVEKASKLVRWTIIRSTHT